MRKSQTKLELASTSHTSKPQLWYCGDLQEKLEPTVTQLAQEMKKLKTIWQQLEKHQAGCCLSPRRRAPIHDPCEQHCPECPEWTDLLSMERLRLLLHVFLLTLCEISLVTQTTLKFCEEENFVVCYTATVQIHHVSHPRKTVKFPQVQSADNVLSVYHYKITTLTMVALFLLKSTSSDITAVSIFL